MTNIFTQEEIKLQLSLYLMISVTKPTYCLRNFTRQWRQTLIELSLLFYGPSILTVGMNTLYELESLVDTPACEAAVVKRKIIDPGGFETEPFNVIQFT